MDFSNSKIHGKKEDSSYNPFQHRAVRNQRTSEENDPDPMVQQQLARLFFFMRKNQGLQNARILDWGCGSGFNCGWLKSNSSAEKITGIDISPATIDLARQMFPNCEFLVADACSQSLNIECERWTHIISCEVLEHVPDMPSFLANIKRHLSPNGTAFITTPHRLVFSLGHEPSPVNQEHVKELDLEEFRALLRVHFRHIEVYGQSFTDSRLLEEWKTDVRSKIQQLKNGTRWQRGLSIQQKLRKFKVVDYLYGIPALKSMWRYFRWELVGRIQTKYQQLNMPYTYGDFEFSTQNLSDAIWFCAIVSNKDEIQL
jgi:ubiquinone/menaquinone biosynthesis C-methylase UbiE